MIDLRFSKIRLYLSIEKINEIEDFLTSQGVFLIFSFKIPILLKKFDVFDLEGVTK